MKSFIKAMSFVFALVLAVLSFSLPVFATPLSEVKHVTLGEEVQKYNTDTAFGVNIHGVDNSSYRVENLEEQVALIARLGVKLVRLGHLEADLEYSDKLMSLFRKYGIKVMLVHSASIKTDPDELEALAETLTMLLTRYNGENGRGYIDYVQIGNETDIGLHEAKNKGYGKDPDDYFTEPVLEDPTIPNLTTAKVFFDTLFAAARKANKNVKTCINFCHYNYGMLRWFKEKGVDFDVVGWDWYYNSTTATPESTAQLCDELHYYFPDKELIVCETNIDMRLYNDKFRNGTHDREDPHVWDGLLAILDVMVEKGYFKYITVYELLDEYHASAQEAFYGLVNTDSVGSLGQPHPIYYDLQKRFGGNEDLRKISVSELDLSGYAALKVKTANDSGIVIDKYTENETSALTPDNDSFNIVSNDNSDISDDLLPDLDVDDESKLDLSNEGSIKKIVKTIVTKKLPWVLVVCVGIGILVASGVGLFIYIKKAKK
ncbi:MAG: glycosyl hydrolase 53 family protein [Clostridia bacterium]|nr:glycosyl hydrolase 53 family protein [Clostridia bacterium]